MVKTVLFICRVNRFRSRVGAGYLRKINKKVKVVSAGAIKGKPVNRNQRKIAKEFGINIVGKTKGLNYKLLKWADIIVVVADNVPLSLFKPVLKKGQKVICWNIKDTREEDIQGMRKIVKKIIAKVKELNETLN